MVNVQNFIARISIVLLLVVSFNFSYSQTTFYWRNDQSPGNNASWTSTVPFYFWNGSAGAVPSGGDILFFDGSVGTTMTNNLTATNRFKITFGNTGAVARTIGGATANTFYDYGGTWPRIQNDATNILHTINFPLNASTTTGINLELVANTGSIAFGGLLNNNGRTIQIYGNNAAVDATNRFIRLTGVLSGTGALNVSQFGVVKLNATHTYTGQTQIDNGELWIESGSIAAGSSIFVGNGGQMANVAKFWLSNATGGTSFTRPITINDGNATTRYLGGLNTSGTNTFSGAITNSSTTGGLYLSALNSGGTTTFSGVISGGGAVLSDGLGTVVLSGTNTYSGGTRLLSGTLTASAAANLGNATGAITIGNGSTVGTLNTTGSFSRTTLNVTDASTAGVINVASAQTFTLTNLNTASGANNTTKIGKSGPGTLRLSGAGTYVGQTQIGDGTVIVSNNAGLGTNNSTTARGIDLGLNVGDVPQASNVSVLATTGITVPQSIYVATNTTSATRTIGLSGASGTATFSNEIYLDGTLTVSGTGTVVLSGRLTNTGGLISNATMVTLEHNANNYSGTTTVNSGSELRLNPSSTGATFASPIVLNGGTLSTTSIVTNRTISSVSTLGLTASSTLKLSATAHTLTFAASNDASWTAAATINITNWAGSYNGTAGTSGRIFIGSNASGLTATQLSQITFFDGTNYYQATLLSTGELVPTATIAALYWGGSGTWDAANKWSLTSGGTANQTWTSGRAAIFNVASSAITGAATNVSSITANENVTLSSVSGVTIGTGASGGGIATFNVATSKTFSLQTNVSFSTSAGSGLVKNGDGILSSGSSTASTLPAGVTLNSGVLAWAGVNGFGSGPLTINGGTLSSSSSSNRIPNTGSITINSDFKLGDASVLSAGTGNLTFAGTVNLGASTTRTITLGNTGVNTFNGIISGSGSNLIIGASAAGTLTLGAANTYGGYTRLNGGTLTLGINNAIPVAATGGGVIFGGGTLNTGTARSEGVVSSTNMGTLTLLENSSLVFGSATAHNLYFAASDAVSWTSGKTLSITSWSGTAGETGTGGRIFVGNSASGLTTAQLAQITINGGAVTQLSTGEIVPRAILYQSKQTGDWSATSTWERSLDGGATWVAATLTPTNAYGTITILHGDSVTINSNETIDQVIVNSGGSLLLSQFTTILNDGPGVDLDISGVFEQNGGTLTQNGQITVRNGGILRQAKAGTVIPTATWISGSTCEVTGWTTTLGGGLNQSFSNFTYNCSGQTSTTMALEPTSMSVGGLFKIASTGTGILTLGNSSTIRSLTVNSFEINAGSFYVTGANASQNMTFNVTNNALQTGGTFEIGRSNTNSGTCAVGGTFTTSSGSTRIQNNGGAGGIISTLTITGNVSIQGGSIDLDPTSAGSNVGRLFVKSNLAVSSGSLLYTRGATGPVTTGSAGVYFDGSSTQTFTHSGGTLSTASGGVGRRFFYKTSSGPTINEVYNSLSAQTTVNGTEGTSIAAGYAAWPTSGSTINNLTIDNSAGLTLSTAKVINGALTLTSGKLTTDGKALTLVNSTTGSSSSYIVADATGTVTMNAVSSAKTIPLGTATSYAPITLSAGSSTNYATYVSSTLACSPADATKVINLAWGINGSNAPSSVVFQWNTADHAASFNAANPVELGRANCPNYEGGSIGTPTGSDPFSITATTGLASGAQIYSIGNDASLLPLFNITTTTAASSINHNSANISGQTLTGSAITNKGIAYHTLTAPTIANSVTDEGTGTSNFTSTLSGLNPQTQYFAKAYVTNSTGTAYANEVNFRTLSAPVTTQATNIVATASAAGVINVSWDAATFPGSGATSAGYALIYATGTPTLSSANGSAPAAGVGTLVTIAPTILPTAPSVSSSISGLTGGTTYNFLLVPFTFDGTNATTYNYLTSGALTTSQTAVALPSVTSTAASSITNATFSSGGTAISAGGGTITAKGVVVGTSANPTTASNAGITNDGAGTANFTSSLSGLNAETQYFARAYVTNSVGTAYGNEFNLRTLSAPVSAQATNIVATASAAGVINVSWDAATFPGSGATRAGYALIYATGTPTLSSANGSAPAAGVGTLVTIAPTILPATPSVSSSISGLIGGTTYNFLLVPFTFDGTNATTYNYLTSGALTTSQTAVAAPSVTSTAASSITSATFSSGGTAINAVGGTISAKGVVVGASANPTTASNLIITNDGTGTANYTSSIAGLTPNTLYNYRAYVTNNLSLTSYGTNLTATSLHNAPAVGVGSAATTSSIIASWSAPTGGGSATFTYEVAISTSATFASTLSTQTSISSATTNATFSALTAGTPYYFRVRANNAGGSSDWSNISAAYATLSDALNLTGLGVTQSENFNTLASSGTSSTTPAGWFFNEIGGNTLYTAGTGSLATGDSYSFGLDASDRAFGTLLSGSVTSTIGAKLTNSTGETITNLSISYTGETWRVGAASRVDRLDFQYSLDATSLTTGNWTDFNSLDYANPGQATGSGSVLHSASISDIITGLSVANGVTFWIRWNDFNASGADDGMAIDDISIKPCGTISAPSASSQSFCANISPTVNELVATGTAIKWYSAASGGSSLALSTGLASGNYYASQTLSGCESVDRTLTAVTINTLSTNPTSATASSTTICVSGSRTLTLNGGSAGSGAVIKWYSASCGGTLVGTGNGLSVSPTETTTYYGRYEGTCNTTTCSSVTITVNQLPTASAGSTISTYVGEYETISGASATNGTILWTENGAGYYDQTWFPVGNPTTVTPTYYVEEGDMGNTVTLTMTVTGLGGCSAQTATATVTLTVDNQPGLWRYQCGTTVPYMDEYIYNYTIPNATNYRIRISDGVTSEIRTTSSTVFFFRQFAMAQYNTTYSCDVSPFVGGAWLAYGPACQVTTPQVPLTKVQASQCGITLATLNTSIFADGVWGANMYEFSCFDGVTTQTFQTTNRYFNITQLASYGFSKTYAVRVRTRVNSTWTAFGESCNVTTPAQLTQIITTQCGINLTDNNTDLYCDAVFNATIYEFRLVNGGTTMTIQKPTRTFKISQIAGIIPGTLYAVSIRTFAGGAWSSFGTACNIRSSATLATIDALNCGTTLTDNNTNIYCLSIPSTTIYEFRLVNGGTTLTIQKPSRTFKLSQLTGILPSLTYAVSVRTFTNGAWTAFGSACNITSAAAVTKIISTQCGTTLTDINTDLYADNVQGATQYRFRVINSAGTVAIVKTSRTFKLTQLTNVKYGVVNAISVDVFINGAWLGYGTSCNVTTPALPTTKIQTSQCGITAASINTIVYADPIYGASQYRFRFNGGLFITKTSRLFKLSDIPQLAVNTTYAIDVAVFVNGEWQSYGTSCNIASPGALALAVNNDPTENQEELNSIDSQITEIASEEIGVKPIAFDANTFPNPFSKEFNIQVNSNSDEEIIIEIRDITGKNLGNYSLKKSDLETSVFGENYQAGLYHVTIKQGNNSKLIKVVKY